jgi:predicted nucleic acid-binding protein
MPWLLWDASALAKRYSEELGDDTVDEVVDSPDFGLLTISDATIFGSLSLMKAHSLNAADAAILATYLRFVHAQPPGSPPCLLVASDKRLLRAAAAEGFATLNPEAVAAAEVSSFLAAL